MFSTDRHCPHVELGRPAESLRFALVTLDVILPDFHKLEAAEAEQIVIVGYGLMFKFNG